MTVAHPAALRPTAVAAALALACLVGLPAAAWAQPAPSTAVAPFDIPAGPLDQALVRFAQLAGVGLSVDASRVAGLRSDGLRGRHGVEQGFALLLRGTGLRALPAAGGYVLAPAAPPAGQAGPAATGAGPTLATITVSAEADGSATTEGTGAYTARSTSLATRLPLAPRETPQSISVITRQRLDDQGLTQLTDVVQQTPGLTLAQAGNAGSDSSPIYARGFQVDNYLVDGVRLVDSNYTDIFQTFDTALVDRVEVLRGASGLLNGIGSPGAAINLVRKRPTATFQASVRGELGSWSHRRGELDVSGPLNAAGTLRGRLVAAKQDNASYIDRLHEKKDVFYGVLEADVGPDTVLHAGLSWQRFDATGHARGGLPAYFSDGSRAVWDVSASAAPEWASSHREYSSLFGGVEHHFSADWSLKATVSRSFNAYDEVIGYASNGYPDRLTGAGVGLWAGRWAATPRQDAADVQVNGRFNLLGRQHDLVFGATAVRTAYFAPAYTNWRHAGWDPSIPNIYLWNGLSPLEPYNPQVGTDDSDERLNSAYGTVRFKPLDGVAVLLGARVTDWRRQQRSQSWTSASLTTADRRERGVVTPYAAITWDFARDWTAYASYTDIFKPQDYKTPTGDQIDPQTGVSREFGIKGSVLDDRLNLSAAVYESKQDNLAVSIPDTFAPDGSQAYRAVSGTRTRGFELEASGELRPGWQLSAGFSRNMTRDRDGQRLLTNVAQNNFKLATSWRMAGVGNGLTVGGAVRWQSGIYADNLGPARNQRFEQPAYAVVDLMLKYPFTPQLSATLNVFNAFDKRYYNTTGNSYWGAPRQLRLGVEARF